MDVTDKILKYCAFQERSCREVCRKLAELKVPRQEAEQILEELKEQNYVNDERFAECFVRGKMNNNRWGRVKIRVELLKRGVDDAIISEKLQMMDEDLYIQNLQYLAARWQQENPSKGRDYMTRFLMSKGYTFDEIRQCASNQEEP